MINRFDRHADRRSRRKGPNHDVLDALSTPVHAPDMTRSIMGRLGYMRVPEEVARRKRRGRVLRRAACLAAIAVALGAGYRVYEQSAAVRHPAELTVPGAIIQEAQQSRMRINNVLESIRFPGAQPPEDDIRSTQPAAAPRYNEQMEPTDPTRDEDVNRSAVAPFRWV